MNTLLYRRKCALFAVQRCPSLRRPLSLPFMGYDSECDGASCDDQPSRPIVIGGHDLRPRGAHDDTQFLSGSDTSFSPRGDISEAQTENLPAHVDLCPLAARSPLEIPLQTDEYATIACSLDCIPLQDLDEPAVAVADSPKSPIAPQRPSPRRIASAHTRPPPVLEGTGTELKPVETPIEQQIEGPIAAWEPARKANSTDFSCLQLDAPSYPMWDRSSIDHWKCHFVPLEVQQQIARGACQRPWQVASLCTGTWAHGSVFWVPRGEIK